MVFALIQLDRSETFHSVQYRNITSKVMSSGINCLLPFWFSSYPTQRSQVVTVGSVTFSARIAASGVVQVSLLDSLLLLSISDASNSVSQGVSFLFADDMQTHLSPAEYHSCILPGLGRLNNCLERFGGAKYWRTRSRAVSLHATGDPHSKIVPAGSVQL